MHKNAIYIFLLYFEEFFIIMPKLVLVKQETIKVNNSNFMNL